MNSPLTDILTWTHADLSRLILLLFEGGIVHRSKHETIAFLGGGFGVVP